MSRSNYRHKNHDSLKYYEWLERAGEDIRSANILREEGDCYNNAAFHCQQTIEKSLKAYLLLKGNKLYDGHNLPFLCKQATRHDKSFAKWLPESASLNKCYIETRYPADIPLDFVKDDIDSYYKMASEMYFFICAEVDRIEYYQ